MMTSTIEKRTLRRALSCLTGLECWAVIAGHGSGSRLACEIGAKVKRDQPVNNPTLPMQWREFIGEFSIFVEDCSWRLEQKGKILCTSKSSNQPEGEMVGNVRTLIGRKIRRACVTGVGLDLAIEFTGALVLRTFSDCASSDEDGDNYTIFTPTRVITVGPKGNTRGQPRGSDS